jgi:aminoglycoside phosphotransferase (APT) family kinase protein
VADAPLAAAADTASAAGPAGAADPEAIGDFHLRNLTVSGDDAGTIRSVLEWELCTLGDPLAVLRRALDEPRNRAGALMPSADQIEALITRARDVAAGSGI